VAEQPANAAAAAPKASVVFGKEVTTKSIRQVGSYVQDPCLCAAKCRYALTMEVRDSPRKPATPAVNPEPGTRRGWIWMIVAGFAVHVLSFVLGLRTVGPLCGSPLIPQSRAAEIFDSLRQGTGVAAECYRNIDSASVPVWILMALGLGLVLTGITVRVVSIRRSGDGSREGS
jgi:hypothetical protein